MDRFEKFESPPPKKKQDFSHWSISYLTEVKILVKLIEAFVGERILFTYLYKSFYNRRINIPESCKVVTKY